MVIFRRVVNIYHLNLPWPGWWPTRLRWGGGVGWTWTVRVSYVAPFSLRVDGMFDPSTYSFVTIKF